MAQFAPLTVTRIAYFSAGGKKGGGTKMSKNVGFIQWAAQIINNANFLQN